MWVIYTLLSVSVIRAYGTASSIRVRFMPHHATNIRENLTLRSIQIQFLTRRESLYIVFTGGAAIRKRIVFLIIKPCSVAPLLLGTIGIEFAL